MSRNALLQPSQMVLIGNVANSSSLTNILACIDQRLPNLPLLTMGLGGTSDERVQQGRVDHDIRNIFSSLTHHLSDLGRYKSRPGSGHRTAGAREGDQGVRITRLKGENRGAIMKADHSDRTNTWGTVRGGEVDERVREQHLPGRQQLCHARWEVLY